MIDETLTPPQLARRWGVHNDKVLTLIRSGELRAMNLAANPNGRPRYKIYLSELERFEETRMTKPPVKKTTRRRRRKTATAAKDYFK